jgi:hypothetical protein
MSEAFDDDAERLAAASLRCSTPISLTGRTRSVSVSPQEPRSGALWLSILVIDDRAADSLDTGSEAIGQIPDPIDFLLLSHASEYQLAQFLFVLSTPLIVVSFDVSHLEKLLRGSRQLGPSAVNCQEYAFRFCSEDSHETRLNLPHPLEELFLCLDALDNRVGTLLSFSERA